jgi:hypothetical protein
MNATYGRDWDELYREKAQELYDIYHEAVGKISKNGEPLYCAGIFFNDAKNQKQINAWIEVAKSIFHEECDCGKDECEDCNMTLEELEYLNKYHKWIISRIRRIKSVEYRHKVIKKNLM